MKYLILSSPRTGSTMLADALNASGQAGRVQEYFHKDQLRKAGNPETAKETLVVYFRYLVHANTTDNQVFGMKIHYNQFEHVFKECGLGMQGGYGFLGSFDKLILIYRQDKVLQSISEVLAGENSLWNSTDASAAGLSKRSFKASDVPKISRIMARQIAEEYGWRNILRERSLEFHQVSYEQLNADPALELQKVSDYLGIAHVSAARPATVKVSDPKATAEIKAAFLSAIGAYSGSVIPSPVQDQSAEA